MLAYINERFIFPISGLIAGSLFTMSLSISGWWLQGCYSHNESFLVFS